MALVQCYFYAYTHYNVYIVKLSFRQRVKYIGKVVIGDQIISAAAARSVRRNVLKFYT